MSRKILYGVTAASTAKAFVVGQAKFVAESGFSVGVVASSDESLHVTLDGSGVKYFPVDLNRNPSPFSDFRQLVNVFNTVRSFRPDVVVAGTPKMSLLLLLSSLLCGVRHRVYLCHGLRYEGERGLARGVLVLMENLFAKMATAVIAVSDSVAAGLIEHGVAEDKVEVLGFGSPDGVDTSKFTVHKQVRPVKKKFVVLFAGRLTADKGVDDLATCARLLPDIDFRVAGEIDGSQDSLRSTVSELNKLVNVHLLGPVVDMPGFYSSGDVLFLPTKREGLPTVVIEAAACGVPTVAWDVTGTRDAVVDGDTGLLIRPGDLDAAVMTLSRLQNSVEMLRNMSTNARVLAERNFDQRAVRVRWVEFIKSLD